MAKVKQKSLAELRTRYNEIKATLKTLEAEKDAIRKQVLGQIPIPDGEVSIKDASEFQVIRYQNGYEMSKLTPMQQIWLDSNLPESVYNKVLDLGRILENVKLVAKLKKQGIEIVPKIAYKVL